jgi:hypothetical protein
MAIGQVGYGAMVVTNPSNTTLVYHTNMVNASSSSVNIQGNLKLLGGMREHVGYISSTPYQVSYGYNVYYITLAGACTIQLPAITSTYDGLYIYIRRTTNDSNTITFESGLANPEPPNIVSEGQYITNAIYNYTCQLTSTDNVRTFRVGTINGISYWFVNTS